MSKLKLDWRKWPLAIKLTLPTTIMIIVAVASVTLLSIRREQQAFRAELEQQAELLLYTLAAAATDPLYNLDVSFLQNMMVGLGADHRVPFGRVYDSEGRVVADASSLVVPFTLDVDPLGQRLVASNTTVFEWQPEQLVAGQAVILGNQRLGAVSVGLSTAPLQAKVAAVRNQGLGIALATSLVGMLLTLLLSRSIIGPVRDLVRATERIASGDLIQQITISGSNEFVVLAATFNSMKAQLRQTLASLENRTRSLEIVTEISEHLVAILNLETLLAEVVNQIKDNFNYYHTHIYLLDEVKEKLIVAEGTGLAGAEMKATGHSIPLNAPASLVARAARTGEIVRVDNVREAEDWLPNPLLPNTYSEMAVPISLAGQVVGVLDVQQDKIAGLDEGDANLLRSLANQVAVAIRNARQFAEVEAALAEAHAVQRQYLAQAWDRTRVTRKSVGRVQFSLGESTTLGEGIIASAQQQVLSHQKPAVVALTGQPDGPATPHALVAPVMLGDVMIGDLQLHGIEPDRAWAESELALINAVIDQVAQTAENLRLLDETQERASREQLVSQISNKMRHAPDMESLLKVAVAELARVLSPARTFVRLDSEATLSATPREIAGNGGSLQPEVDQT